MGIQTDDNRTRDGGPTPRSVELLALAATFAGLAVALVLGLLSDGVYHDDDICHYTYALDAWHSTRALLDWWARPGYNIPTMFVARFFGVPGCRIFSALMTAGTAYLSYRIARRVLGCTVAAALAPALVWLQPLVMTLAETTLTETPAALYLTAGVWLFMRGNRILGCAAMSATFVTRFETLVLAPVPLLVAGLDAMRRGGWRIGAAAGSGRVWACLAALLWAPVAYVVASAMVELPPEASVLHMFSRRYVETYGSGAWHHYLAIWAEGISVGLFALTVAGALAGGRRAWLVTVMTFGLLGVHTLLFANGMFASGGYARFLVTVGGLAGALAACGLQAAWRGEGRFSSAAIFAAFSAELFLLQENFGKDFRAQRVVAPICVGLLFWAGVAAVVRRPGPRRLMGRFAASIALGFAAVQWIAQVGPLTTARAPVHDAIARAVREMGEAPYAGRHVLCQHVLVRFFLPDAERTWGNQDAAAKWRAAPPGTLFVWESKDCCPRDDPASTRLLQEELRRLGRLVCRKQSGAAAAEVFERLPDGGSRSRTSQRWSEP